MVKGQHRGSTGALPRFESLTADGVGTVFSSIHRSFYVLFDINLWAASTASCAVCVASVYFLDYLSQPSGACPQQQNGNNSTLYVASTNHFTTNAC